jgi:hypothetical protein
MLIRSLIFLLCIVTSLLANAHLSPDHTDNNAAYNARLKYMKDMMEINEVGYIQSLVNHQAFDIPYNAHTNKFPGMNTSTYLGFKKSIELLTKLGSKLKNGQWTRGNTLGTYILNNLQWVATNAPNHQIALGLSIQEHEQYRPLLVHLLDGQSERAKMNTQKTIDESVVLFLQKIHLNKSLAYPRDINIWSMQLLFKILFDQTISEEKAAELTEFRLASLQLAVGYVEFNGVLLPSNDKALIKMVTTQRERVIKELMPFVEKKFPNKDPRASANIMLDALLFAGGTSIPSTVGAGLAVLYGGKLSADGNYGSPLGKDLSFNSQKDQCPPITVRLSGKQLEHFIWELFRYYPPVGGISWYDSSDANKDPFLQKRTLVSLRSALKDPAVWQNFDGTPDPDAFRLNRPLTHYLHYATIAWAEPANNTSAGPGFQHGCPAQHLSFAIIKSFFKYWNEQNPQLWCMTAPGFDQSGISKLKTSPNFRPFPAFTLGLKQRQNGLTKRS